jgi:hypothetical protein
MVSPFLDSLKSPLAQLFESVQGICRNSVVNFFPGFVDDAGVCPGFFSVEIETHSKKELSLFDFPSLSNG